MKQIPLTQGKFALVDDRDYDWLSQWNWCYSNGYARRNIPTGRGKQSSVFMHRVIMNTSNKMDVDHINHDTLDNRRDNLRNCTHAENLKNHKRNKTNTTGFKGVSKQDHRFTAKIMVDGKRLHLGMYGTPEEAAHVYDEAAKKHHGEFAMTNKSTEISRT